MSQKVPRSVRRRRQSVRRSAPDLFRRMAAKQNWTDFRMKNDPEFRSKMIATVERAAEKMRRRFEERITRSVLIPDCALYVSPQQWFGSLSSIIDTPSIEEIKEELHMLRMQAIWQGLFSPQPIPAMAMSILTARLH